MDEFTTGNYGSMACRAEKRHVWTCFDSSDYIWVGVVDDYGNIVRMPGTGYTNVRGY